MRFFITLLLLSAAHIASAITTGQVPVQVYNGTGFTTTYVTIGDGQVIGKTSGVPAAITPFDGVFSSLSGKPTTSSGYGITDVQTLTGTLALAGFGSITGAIPEANGGTGQTSLQASINALAAASGALSQGDIFYYNGTNFVRLAAGTSGYYLKTQGTGANPLWAAVPSGLTIGSTAISGGTSGRLLTSGTTVGELSLGTGISTALGNAVNGSGGVLTYGIIGTSGATVPLLNGANTFGSVQIINAPTGATDPLLSLKMNSSSVFDFSTAGRMTIKSGSSDCYIKDSNVMELGSANQTAFYAWGGGGLILPNGCRISFSNGGVDTRDILLSRVSAGILKLEHGTSTSPASLQIWGTSSGSKYLSVGHDGTDAVISASSGSVNITTGGLKIGAGTAIAHIKRYSVTLVAGTATVSDSDITANTQVIVSVLTPGGTVGDLDFDVSAGSSFTVNSTSATDTRTIICTVIIY